MAVVPRRITRIAGTLLLMTVIAVTASTVQARPAAAATGGTIVGAASGRCLDVVGNRNANAATIDIYGCSGHANQVWTYTAKGELRVFSPAKCLDVVDHDVTAPARVQLYACTGKPNQQWKLGADGTIVGVESGLCLDVGNARTDNGAPVGMWTCNQHTNQKWRFPKVADRQAPSAPTGPRTSDLTCTAVTFAWNASTDDTGVSGYDVYHDGQLLTSVAGGVTSTRLTVVPGTPWDLYVTARDAAGNVSQASPEVAVTPPACGTDTRAPSTPTDLRASATGTDVSLSWTASTDDVGVVGYDVFRDGTRIGTVSATTTDSGVTTPPPTRYLDAAPATSTGYSYTVLARDAKPNNSPKSAAATVRTGATCATVCRVTQVATDPDLPWGLVTLPDGSVLYSRRDAHDVIRLDPATGARSTVGVVPNVLDADGQGGLFGLAIAPTFATDHWLYLMQTSPTDNRVVRIRLTDGRLDLGSEQVLVSGIPRGRSHNGGRLRFGPDGKLYVATGDGENAATAQDLSVLSGKILRIDPDGSVPADNPFHNAIWSYGHRNPQGLAFDSHGRLWEQEFGNSIMDETNLITRGGNYGWPQCEGTSGSCGGTGLIAPKQTYPTADGSCSGLAIVGDVAYIGCERGQRLYREMISGDTLTDVRSYYVGSFGRLRTVEPAADGGLWLTTTNDGDADSTDGSGLEKILHVSLGGAPDVR